MDSNRNAGSFRHAAADCRVTIVVAPRERFEQAEMSLGSLFDATDTPFKLIYVDGGSPAPIAKALEAAVIGAGHSYVRQDRYLSPNQARNLAMPLIDTDYVAFVDNDVAFMPGWLSALIACADETGAGLVTPTILVGHEARMPDLKIHHAGGVLDIRRAEDGWRMSRSHEYEHERYLERRAALRRSETGCTEFHAVLARRAMLDDIGPFDEQLVGFTDEIDMALSARKRGWTIYFEPDSVVVYAVGKAITWRETAYFCVRWSTGLCMGAERHFYAKWNLVPEFQRQLDFLRDHRRHAFPFARLQQRLGWRITVWLTTVLCETIAYLSPRQIHLSRPTAQTVAPAGPAAAQSRLKEFPR